MALHGLIEVNGWRIGHWAAQRLNHDVIPGQPSTYKCEVQPSRGPKVTFTVEHAYEDGAVALAAKVLTEAAKGAGQ